MEYALEETKMSIADSRCRKGSLNREAGRDNDPLPEAATAGLGDESNGQALPVASVGCDSSRARCGRDWAEAGYPPPSQGGFRTASARPGCGNWRLKPTPSVAVLGLALVLAFAGAGAAEDGAVQTVGYELVIDGRVDIEVIDGLAIYDGDIVLGRMTGSGTLQPLTRTALQPLAEKKSRNAGPARRDVAYSNLVLPVDPDETFLMSIDPWPDGSIPYTIGSDVDPADAGVIRKTIDFWNEQTEVPWVPSEYGVEIVTGNGNLTWGLGAGSSRIIVGSPVSRGTLLHEMGHVAGLMHGHERTDASQYLNLGIRDSNTVASKDYPVFGPFDYASTMNYYSPPSRPPGIIIGPGTLSAGDIDAINRIHGKHPQTTTISTYPPEGTVTVDGVDYRTPAVFSWTPGSQHVVSVPSSLQCCNRAGYKWRTGDEYVFARWSDGGAKQHSITARADTTWFTAYYSVRTNAPCGLSTDEANAMNSPAVWQDFLDYQEKEIGPSRFGLNLSTGAAIKARADIMPNSPDLNVPWGLWKVFQNYSAPVGSQMRIATRKFSRRPLVPIWFGRSIPEQHGQVGSTEIVFSTDRLDERHIHHVQVQAADQNRILLEDEPREFEVRSWNDFYVPYWISFDGLTVDLVSSQAEDLDVFGNLPAEFKRMPWGLQAVVEYQVNSTRYKLPTDDRGRLFRIGVRNSARNSTSVRGRFRIHSVKRRHGPARITDRSLRLFSAASGNVPRAQTILVSNESGEAVEVRLESGQFRLATSPEVLSLAGSDLQPITVSPLVDGLGPGTHEGTVRLVPVAPRAGSSGPERYATSEEFPIRVFVPAPSELPGRLVSISASRPQDSETFKLGESISIWPHFSSCAPSGNVTVVLDIGGQARSVDGPYRVQASDLDLDGARIAAIRLDGVDVNLGQLDSAEDLVLPAVDGGASATPTITDGDSGAMEEDSGAMEFVRIPAGSFLMGSPDDEAGTYRQEAQHERSVDEFWLGKYEVTQAQWLAVMVVQNPSYFSDCGSSCPVETVSWIDVQRFIERLNELESESGYQYRLPTEAEWEYAARAGTTGPHYGEILDIAWIRFNSGGTTHPVGQKPANAWGLHDMLGNVAEWTASPWEAYPGEPYPSDFIDGDQVRVIRGGHWRSPSIRVASRRTQGTGPWDYGWHGLGFRLVRMETGIP